MPRYRATRLTWCIRHLRLRRQDWANNLFTDESRFHVESSDDRSRVYCHEGERCADTCVMQRRMLSGGSATVWGCTTERSRTLLVVVRNLTWMCCRNEIVQCYVFLSVTSQQENAGPHVARVLFDYLTQQNVDVLSWPAVSPRARRGWNGATVMSSANSISQWR